MDLLARVGGSVPNRVSLPLHRALKALRLGRQLFVLAARRGASLDKWREVNPEHLRVALQDALIDHAGVAVGRRGNRLHGLHPVDIRALRARGLVVIRVRKMRRLELTLQTGKDTRAHAGVVEGRSEECEEKFQHGTTSA